MAIVIRYEHGDDAAGDSVVVLGERLDENVEGARVFLVSAVEDESILLPLGDAMVDAVKGRVVVEVVDGGFEARETQPLRRGEGSAHW